jgi:hypothetical protein
VVVNKVLQRLAGGEAADSGATAATDLLKVGRRAAVRRAFRAVWDPGQGVEDVMLRLAAPSSGAGRRSLATSRSAGASRSTARISPNAAQLRRNP